MTTVEDALEQFNYLTLEEVSSEDLKKRFRTVAKEVHPDHGGADDAFDKLLSAYLMLNRILRRQAGGRDSLQGRIYVDDVKESRERQFMEEMNNSVSELIMDMGPLHSMQQDALDKFNAAFEKTHVREYTHGYAEWLHSTPEENDDNGDEKTTTITPDAFHSQFIHNAMQGKPAPTTLILHPEQMAMRPSFGGYDPSRLTDYTADIYSCPDFTDLKDAYETETTVVDKVPEWNVQQAKTFEELLAERDLVYKTEADRDLEMIAAYERTKEEEWKANEQRMQTYFQSTGSSVWALRQADDMKTDDSLAV